MTSLPVEGCLLIKDLQIGDLLMGVAGDAIALVTNIRQWPSTLDDDYNDGTEIKFIFWKGDKAHSPETAVYHVDDDIGLFWVAAQKIIRQGRVIAENENGKWRMTDDF